MNNAILTDGEVVRYVVRVNGQERSERFDNAMLAEMAKHNLSPEERAVAEVVPVTADGKQVLLG